MQHAGTTYIHNSFILHSNHLNNILRVIPQMVYNCIIKMVCMKQVQLVKGTVALSSLSSPCCELLSYGCVAAVATFILATPWNRMTGSVNP